MGAELLAASDVGPSDEQQGPRDDDPVDVLEDFGETPVYEVILNAPSWLFGPCWVGLAQQDQ